MTTSHQYPERKIVVALDGSPAAATALPVAARVADQLGAELEVLVVRPDDRPAAAARAPLRLPAVHAGLAVRTLVGAPDAGIISVAADPAVLLVVMTTHGRAVGSNQRLGSVAAGVIASTTCPVLLVRPEVAARAAAGAQAQPPLRRLLFPLDGTPTTAAALPPATHLASDLGAAIDLLYVADNGRHTPPEVGSIGAPRYLDQPHHEWRAWEREVIDRLCTLCAACPPDVPVEAFLRAGDIGTEIIRFAHERHADAIILVRRSRLEQERAPVLRAVLAHAPCPILLIGTAPAA